MGAVGMVIKNISGIILAIVSVFRRMLCFLHIVRRRKNSGTLLPMTNDQTSILSHDVQPLQSVPSNDLEEFEAWDSWGPSNMNFSQSTGISQNHMSNHVTLRQNSVSESDPEPEMDFFQDMVPEVKRSTKILIRKKEEYSGQSGLSSRLAMTSMLPSVAQVNDHYAGSELGQWDESESAWSSEAMEDLSWQADSALRDVKHQERLRRHEEQQQRKLQKELERKQRKDGHLAAVKLS